MKKLLFFGILLNLFAINASGQCTTANQTITENFNSSWPSCWTLVSYSTHASNSVRVTSSWQSPDAYFVMPKAVNAKGTLEFWGKNTTNGQQGFGPFTIGAVSDPGSMGDFEAIANVNIYPTISGNQIISKKYTVDLSGYTGSHQYIVFKMTGNSAYSRTIYIDDINYTSGCIASTIDAQAKDITVQLDNSGSATITAQDVDNGSTSDCNDFTLSIDKNTFDCSNIGANTVKLYALNNQNVLDSAYSTVTVLGPINDETVTVDDAEVCPNTATNVNIGSSVAGINYWLKDSATNNIVAGPTLGTGNGLSFNTGNISQKTTYKVYGETVNTATGLKFDGVNNQLVFNNNGRGISTQVTISAWVKTTFTGATNFAIAAKYNGTTGFVLFLNASGQASIDGRDNTGVYKSSGASTTAVNDGQWHYVTGTINVSTGVWAIYIDGVLENSAALAAGSTLANTYNLSVGHYTTYRFTGSIDELSFWNKALNATEINQYKANCLSGSESGCVGLFNFNEGSGTVANDLSSYAAHGTVTNFDASDWETNNFTCGQTCDFTMTQRVTVSLKSGPVTTTSLSGVTITADEAGATYQWLDCDNGDAPINGAMNQSYTAPQNGNYKCEITKDCIKDTTACVTILTVGTEALQTPLQFFPNPVQTHLNVLSNIQSGYIIVTDINGKTVYESSFSPSIPVEMLNEGVYFIRIQTSKKLYAARFIKK